MEILVLVAFATLLLPATLYFALRFGKRGAWGVVLDRYETRGEGAYRRVRLPTWKLGKAPISVQIAAVTSFFLGQMVVPGGLVAMIGVVFALADLAGPRPPNWLLVASVLSSP